jgi:uncharacterized protein (TIGR03435 family)
MSNIKILPVVIGFFLIMAYRPCQGGTESRTKFPPSYQVHITASEPTQNDTSSDTGSDHWVTSGFELQETIGDLYNVDASRVVLPSALEHKKYDVALVLPKAEARESILDRVRQAIQKRFGLTLVFETRPMDVYVLSALPGHAAPTSPAPKEPVGVHMALSGVTVAVRDDRPSEKELLGVDVSGMTMEQLAHVLESGLDRLVVDETGLKGKYDVKTQPEASSTAEFFRMLHGQCGLDLTPGRRKVKVLVARAK